MSAADLDPSAQDASSPEDQSTNASDGIDTIRQLEDAEAEVPATDLDPQLQDGSTSGVQTTSSDIVNSIGELDTPSPPARELDPPLQDGSSSEGQAPSSSVIEELDGEEGGYGFDPTDNPGPVEEVPGPSLEKSNQGGKDPPAPTSVEGSASDDDML